MDRCFFSVIVPVHNKLPHLERSIASVLGQTHKNFELLIVDDASTDGSAEKLKTFNDPRIKLLHRDVAGAGGYAARNMGIANATAEWICFLDADDEWDLGLLDMINSTILLHIGIEGIAWGWNKVNGEKRKLDRTSVLNSNHHFRMFGLKDLFTRRHTIWTGAVCFKKDLLQRAGLFPETGFKRGGDVDTWIRCLHLSKGNVWINKAMSFYYVDAVNMVTKTVKRESLYIFAPYLLKLKTESDDAELVKAIVGFQNDRIYTILRWQIIEKEPFDYFLFKKMDMSVSTLVMAGKLAYNKLKYIF